MFFVQDIKCQKDDGNYSRQHPRARCCKYGYEPFDQRKLANFFIIKYNLLLCETMSFEMYMVQVTHHTLI